MLMRLFRRLSRKKKFLVEYNKNISPELNAKVYANTGKVLKPGKKVVRAHTYAEARKTARKKFRYDIQNLNIKEMKRR